MQETIAIQSARDSGYIECNLETVVQETIATKSARDSGYKECK